MVNDWLLEIRRWLLEVKGRGFLLRHFFEMSPARPPLLRSAGGFFFGWGLAQRLVYSLNKFKKNYRLETQGLLACSREAGATHKRPRWSAFA